MWRPTPQVCKKLNVHGVETWMTCWRALLVAWAVSCAHAQKRLAWKAAHCDVHALREFAHGLMHCAKTFPGTLTSHIGEYVFGLGVQFQECPRQMFFVTSTCCPRIHSQSVHADPLCQRSSTKPFVRDDSRGRCWETRAPFLGEPLEIFLPPFATR